MPHGNQILTVAQMQAAEQVLVDGGQTISSLMERAGAGAAQWVWRMAAGRSVTVLCGPGNNGGDGPRSTPTVAGGKVFILGANLDLHALDATTGKSLWSKDIVAEHGGRNIQWKNAASPLLEDGLIYVAGGGEGQALLAIKADSGEVAWKAEEIGRAHV